MVDTQNKIYDLIIIGAGPAGLTASIYASRYKLDHLIIGETPGGQGLMAGTVENYPGFASISGVELMQKMVEHAKGYGVELVQAQVKKIEKVGDLFKISTGEQIYQAKTLILAMGSALKSLGIPGEEEFIGKGVSHCTTCDAPFFKNKIVAVVGGGNAALMGAIHLTAFAEKVYLIHRRGEFRGEPYRIDIVKKNPKIELILSTQVKEIKGTNVVEEMILDKPYKGLVSLKVNGVFIEIGHIPSSTLAAELGVEVDAQNHVLANPDMTTNIPGVFVAGDLITIKGGILLHQYVTATAEGATATSAVYRHFRDEVVA